MSTRLAHVRSVLAVGAHPDDLEVGAGGLIARLAAQGAAVTMVVASIPNRVAVRRAEAIAGAARLGARLVLPPGDAPTRIEDAPMHALVARFDQHVAECAPDLVLVHGPDDAHWDHGLVHRAMLSALRRARCEVLTFTTRLPVGAPPAAARVVADIGAVIDAKIAAIAEHASQFPASFAESRREAARALGAEHGLPFAEAFEAVRVVL